MKLIRSKFITRLFFALLLVVAQGQLLIHQTEFEAHSGQDSCELCIHIGHLGNGIIAKSHSIALLPVHTSYSHVVDATTLIAFDYIIPPPRAPPFPSLI